ncbi:MAG: hypothetical protein IPN05_08325 [Sulfuritalea sp.]|nr:hypothetical protein [Sulfuritalea sp.]
MDIADQGAAPAGLEGEVVAQAFGIQLSGESRARRRRAPGWTRRPAARMFAPEQRLDADPVAGQQLPSARSWMAKANMPSSLSEGLHPSEGAGEHDFSL